MGFLLFLVAVLLSAIFYPLAFISSIIKAFYKMSFKEGLDKLSLQCGNIAFSIDLTGNVVCDDMFNVLLIKSNGYKFGNPKETISSVLGKNSLNKTLSPIGWILASTLNLIDKNHCISAIDNTI